MGLRDIGASLPPGFRFYPSDEELVCHYLYQKTHLYPPAAAAASSNNSNNTLVEIDLHTCEPWQLPEIAKLNSHEWYFFSFRDRKYATGFRTNRATTTGYWKATGKDRTILDPMTRSIVGMRKTLVFYKNRAPNGIKTSWIMHEFRLENPNLPPKEDWVLCRVFEKPKSETNSGELSPPTYDNCTGTPAAASPTFATSPPPLDHAFASSYPYNISSSSIRDDSPPTTHDQRTNQLDSHDIMNITNFPFFFGMNMNLGGVSEDSGAPVVLEDMQFDMDLDMDMDGTMVFI